MISVIHTPVDEMSSEGDDFPIPAGGRCLQMDWDRITAAFECAVRRLGWDVDLEIRPEKQNVMVRVHPGAWNSVTQTTDDFYALVEDAVGTEAFMSIWIDFASADTCSTLPTS